jgi:polyisoprenoid-binding protein YceI
MTNLPVPGIYPVDTVHSSVNFATRHLVGSKVRGHFTEFEGTITVGDSPETSSVVASVQAHSITTDNEQRDGHLKSPDFLDQANFPTLEFKSTAIRAIGDDRYELDADVTIHGITKSLTFELEYLGAGPSVVPGAQVVGFDAKTTIDRRDFDVSFNRALDTGGLMLSNHVEIEINVEAHQKV